jgi:hypothetical protein
MNISETYTYDGILIEFVNSIGHHYLENGEWLVSPLSDDERAEILAAQSPLQILPSTENRLAAIEQAVSALASRDPQLAQLPEILAMESMSPVIETDLA